MRLLAASGASPSTGALLTITVVSAYLLVRGLQHYRGRNRWVLRWLPWQTGYFGSAWFGAGGLLLVLCILAGKLSVVLEAILAIPAVPTFAIGVVSMFWMPERLLPAWYLAERRSRPSRPRTTS